MAGAAEHTCLHRDTNTYNYISGMSSTYATKRNWCSYYKKYGMSIVAMSAADLSSTYFRTGYPYFIADAS